MLRPVTSTGVSTRTKEHIVRRLRKTTQHAGRSFRRPATIAAATILAIGALAGTAAAVLSASSGAGQLHMENRGETAPAPAPGMAWVTLPGSEIQVNANEGHLINARFTAESTCSSPAAGSCVVRIVADHGMITELDPASGTDFAFDTDVVGAADADGAEAHAMERSRRLPAGNYDIRVEYAVTNAATVFTVDDWHFAVETSQ
jgi:hypothetical protein